MKLINTSKRSKISPFYAMEVLKEANKLSSSGIEVLHLEIGEPSVGPPKKVLKRASEILSSGVPLNYTDALGIKELRQEIVEYYKYKYQVSLNYNNIAITNGSSSGFLLSILAGFDVGQKIGITIPCYPAYRNMMISLGITPVEIHTTLNDRFQPTLDLIKNAGDIDGLLIASPSNPTGTMLNSLLLNEISDYCNLRGIRLISDEIYHGITYNEPSQTLARINKKGIILNGFSKYFCMTGWRLGWVIVPDDLLDSMERLAQNLFISSNSLSQMAAIAAFDEFDYLDNQVKNYSANREQLIDMFSEIGVNYLAPVDGAFYIYANISNLSDDSVKFCKEMLHNTGVAITPGIDFDTCNGSAFIRLSYAGSEQIISKACKKIRKWLL